MLRRTASQFRLSVADDGKGERGTKALGPPGFGSLGMRREVRGGGGHRRRLHANETQEDFDRDWANPAPRAGNLAAAEGEASDLPLLNVPNWE